MKIVFAKVDDRAVIPSFGTEESAGMDLSVIEEIENPSTFFGKPIVAGATAFFHTGLKMQCPKGYYAKIHCRSSISFTGIFLANNTGIIDSDYTGEIYLAFDYTNGHRGMRNVRNMLADGHPWRCCQIVLHKCEQPDISTMPHVDFVERYVTKRGSGGFGSTNDA